MIMSERIPSDEEVQDFSAVHHSGGLLVACVDGNGGVWTWSASTGEWLDRPLPYAHAGDPIVAPYPDADNTLDRVAVSSVDGRLLLAAGGDEQEPALWDLDTGELLWRTPLNGAYLTDVIALDGAFVTAQQYSEEVRLWSPDGKHTVLGVVGELYCLAGTRIGGRSLIIAGGSGARVWDAATLSRIASFESDDERLWAVTACGLGERTVVFGGTAEGELYAWNLAAEFPETLYEPVAVSDVGVEEMAVVTVAGRPLVVTGGDDSLRLWDPADGSEVGHVGTGEHGVSAMEATVVDGRPVLVTAGRDGVLRIWDESDLV